jgi:hypothetical protein
MALRNLLVQLGVEVTGKQELAAADNAITRMLVKVEGLSGALKGMAGALAIGAAAGGLISFISNTLKAADALYNQAAKLGLTTDELQKYQYASAQFGITQNETAVAFRFFNRMIGEAQLGTKGAVKTMGQLGISMAQINDPTLTTGKALEIFSDKLEKMPNQFKRTAFVMRTLGRGGSAMLPILQQGSKKIREVFSDLDEMGGGFDKSFVEMAHSLEIQFKKMKLGWTTVSAGIVKELVPAIKIVVDWGMKLTKTLVYITKHTYGLRTALMYLAVVGSAMAIALGVWLAAMFPILAPLAIFVGLMVALYLAFDDFYTFLMGGDSALGEFLNKLMGTEGAKKFRKDLVDAFTAVKDALFPLLPSIKDLSTGMIKAFAEALPSIIQFGTSFVTYVVEAVDMAISGVRILANSLEALGDTILSIFDLGSGKGFSAIWGDAGDANDKITSNLSDRMDALSHLRDVLGKIGQAPGAGGAGSPTAHQSLASYRPGGSNFSGPAAPDQPQGDLGLPAPPAPGGVGGVHVEVHNTWSPGAPPKTKVKVNGMPTQNRNTYDATTEGMPSVADQ